MDFAFSQIRKRVRVLLSVAAVLAVIGLVNAIRPATFDLSFKKWSVPLPTEQVWIVRSLTRDLGRFAALASRKSSDLWHDDAVQVTATAFADGYDWYRVRVAYGDGQTWETELRTKDGPWDPATYVGFTQGLFERAGVERRAPAPAEPHYSPLTTLVMPRPEMLQHENARLSARLTQAPLDAEAHEEAALLAATLAWRDSSGAFRDPRDLCERATAHLIMARALRDHTQTETGAMAALFITLAGKTTQDAPHQLRRLAARAVTSPELNPWISTAEMALGRDWHDVAAANNPTLLERVELFRAICRTEGTTKACVQLGSRPFEDVADWTRILFEHTFTPGEGRRFCGFALPFETDEAVRIFPELAGLPVQSAAFAKVLNAPIEPAVIGDSPASGSVSVIGAGLWGHYLQRHLCHVICRTADHLRATAALEASSTAFCASAAIVYRHLKLVPLAAVASNDEQWLTTASPAVAQLVRQHPDWVSQKIWSRFMRNAAPTATRGLPSVAQWVGSPAAAE